VSGRGGLIHTSRDGESWTPRVSGVTNEISSVSFANHLFVATGTDGLLLTSPDGITWTRRESSTTNRLAKATYGHGVYVVVGDAGTILVSTDGASWNRAANSDAYSLSSILALPDRFIAGGEFGTILTSGYFGESRIQALTFEAPSELQLTIQGQVGTTLQLQSRESLAVGDWLEVFSLTQTNEIQKVSIPVDHNVEQVFYRTVSN
jgi:photosystem II stability/assembly factor-like uncharacterized protein